MGQPVAVVIKPSSNPGIVRYELNRTLTGMGHVRYAHRDLITDQHPGATLARRLFDTGKVAAVAVYGNMVTIDLAKGQSAQGLDAIVESLYTYYVPGFVPPPIEMPAEVAAAPAAVGAGAGEPALTGAAARVPAHLLERSRAARERWKAQQAG